MDGLASLPPWLQITVSVAVFFGTVIAGILGYTKKKFGSKVEDQRSQDSVVISAAFADRRVIESLSDSIRAGHDATDRNTDASMRVVDAINRQTDSIRDLCEMLRKQADADRRERTRR